MPRKARELTATEVRRLAHPKTTRSTVTHAVGGVDGLQLSLAPSGGKSWVLRYRMGPKRREIGLGGFPDVTLAAARESARVMRQAIHEGRDPAEERKVARIAAETAQRRDISFGQVMESFLEGKLKEFDNDKHRKQWRATLDAHAVPILGDMPIDDVTVQDVLSVLSPIWETKTETASRLRGRLEMVFAYAIAQGHRSGENPARWKGNLAAILPKPTKVAKVQHQPALAVADAPRWFAEVQRRDGIATRALEFTAMTAARSGEVRGARWDEIEGDVWTIPADRMKAGNEYRVPLTPEAVALLDTLPRDGELIFPAAKGGQLSDAALSACMKRVNAAEGFTDAKSGRPPVPHGLRSTFRDWAAEAGVERDLAEMSLAHTVGSEVERAYRRTDMFERRRTVLIRWMAVLSGNESDASVVPLKA